MNAPHCPPHHWVSITTLAGPYARKCAVCRKTEQSVTPFTDDDELPVDDPEADSDESYAMEAAREIPALFSKRAVKIIGAILHVLMVVILAVLIYKLAIWWKTGEV